MSASRKTLIIAVAMLSVVIGLGLLYLVLVPLWVKGWLVLRPRSLDLEEARNYYTVISAAAGSFVGVAGLLLGAAYYLHRLKWEEARAARERLRERVRELREKIDIIDEEVTAIIYGSEGESVTARVLKVLGSLSVVLQLVDHAEELEAVGDDEIRDIVRIASYLDGWCRFLLERSSDRGSRESALREIDAGEFQDRLYDARRALHKFVKP